MGNDQDNAASTPTPGPAPVQPGQPTPQPAAAPMSPAPAPPAPASSQVPAEPPPAGSFFKNLSHAFIGSVLGGLAGRKTTSYQVDNNPNSPNYGQTMATNADMSHGDQLKQIARNALVGLAAGSAQPDRGSKLANALSGLGAGAGAQQKQTQEQDQLKRKNADEDFEQQQRAMVNRSNMAHLNAESLKNWYENIKLGNEMDPLIQHDAAEFKAVQDSPELGHGTIMTDAEVANAMKADHNWATEHAVYNLGRVPLVDSEGHEILDPQTHQPMTQTKLGVVGAHDGQYKVPQAFVDDVKQYGVAGGIGQADVDAVSAGLEMPFNQYIAMKARIVNGENKVLEGWKSPKDGYRTGDSGEQIPVRINSVDPTLTKDYPQGVTPNEENKTLKGTPGAILSKLESDPAETSGDKAAAVMAMAQARQADPKTSPSDRVRWQHIESQAAVSARITEQQKAALARVQESAKDGDPNDAAQLLVAGVSSPAEMLSTRRPEFTTAVIKRAHEIDPTWKANVADAQFTAAKSQQNVAMFGSGNSLVAKGGTLDQLEKIGKQIPQGQFPKWNTYADWVAASTGTGPIAEYAAKAIGVADDYGKVMGAGSASDSARDTALNIIAANQSPDQRAGALRGIRGSVNSQMKERIGTNKIMDSMYGYAITPDGPTVAMTQAEAQAKGATHKTKGPDGKMHYATSDGTDLGAAE